LFDFYNTAPVNWRIAKTLDSMVTEPIVLGRKTLASCIVSRHSAFVGTFSYHVVYLMANYIETGTVTAKHIKIHRFQIYPVTVTDALTQQHAAAIVDLEGNAVASLVMRAKAGGAAGSVEIVAADNAVGGAASRVTLTGDEIGFDGMSVFDGPLQSSNFSAGSTGWQITEAGGGEFNNLINRSSVVDGAVSNGGVYAVVITPTTYVHTAYTAVQSFGAMTLSEIWTIGITVSVINAKTVAVYNAKSGAYTYDLYFTIAQPIYRLKTGATWGSWIYLGSPVQSDSHTVYKTGTTNITILGEYTCHIPAGSKAVF